jgi:hypothetical protein
VQDASADADHPVVYSNRAGAVTPLAAASIRELPGPVAVLRDVIRTAGVRGLWLGQAGTLIRETGGSAAWFGTKELVCKLLRKDAPERQLRPSESALSGACAGAAYNLAFFPADTVKSTMQTEAELRAGHRWPEVVFDCCSRAISCAGYQRAVCGVRDHGRTIGAQQCTDILDIRWVKSTVWVENCGAYSLLLCSFVTRHIKVD